MSTLVGCQHIDLHAIHIGQAVHLVNQNPLNTSPYSERPKDIQYFHEEGASTGFANFIMVSLSCHRYLRNDPS